MVKDVFLHNGGQRSMFAYIAYANSLICLDLLKGPDPSYLVLKVGNILPINNCDMTQNVISQWSWPWKVKVIGPNKWHHRVPWPNIDLDTKIVILSVLESYVQRPLVA